MKKKTPSGNRNRSRRDFLKQMGLAGGLTFSADTILQSILASAILPMGRARAAPGDQKFIFVSFPGGYDPTLTFDPKPFYVATRADGAPETLLPFNGESQALITDNIPIKRMEQSPLSIVNKMFYLNEVNLSKYALKAGSHQYNPNRFNSVDWRRNMQGERIYDTWSENAPPILLNGGIEWGHAIGPLIDQASRATLFRGVTATATHEVAQALLWTGHPDGPEARNPTLDCLIAAKLGGGVLFPHLKFLGERNATVTQNLPVEANSLAIPEFLYSGSQFKDFFSAKFQSRLSGTHPQAFGSGFRDAIKSIATGGIDQILGGNLSIEDREFYQQLKNQFTQRNDIYDGDFLANIEGDITTFMAEAEATLQPKLAMVHPQIYTTSLPTYPARAWNNRYRYTCASAACVASMINRGVCTVANLTLNPYGGSWDSHTDHFGYGVPEQMEFNNAILGLLISKLDMTNTTLVFLSDVGREPILDPIILGKNHNDSTAIALIGGKLGQGHVFGATDDLTKPLPVDLATGGPTALGANGKPQAGHDWLETRHILAGVLLSVGYTETEVRTLTGLGSIPPYLHQWAA